MQKNKIISTSISIIVLILATAAALAQPKGQPKGKQNVYTPPTVTNSTTSSYTLAQISTHNNANSCWTTINGSVYDLTPFIKQHPGGEGAIMSICGKDGTSAFEGQHAGQGRPEKALATLKIGKLAK